MKAILKEVHNYIHSSFKDELARDVGKGLTASQKYIPCKYFYDSRGSKLFEKICLLPEYYPTRTELSILKNAAPEIMSTVRDYDIVELGSGANWKVRVLLDSVDIVQRSLLRYVPVDVSERALLLAIGELHALYPELETFGVVADFTRHLEAIPGDRKKLLVFFGSTIGNFDEKESRSFLKRAADMMKTGDRFLIGLDMVKNKEVLEAAYNDSKGITSAFNKNVLHVINRELQADFDPAHFDHVAFFNEEQERIEMHLRANRTVEVVMRELGTAIQIDEGETIRTEICRKFSKQRAGQMFDDAGLAVRRWFADRKGWFSLVELRKE